MKPFDLEQAKAGKPLITRDGRDAVFGCYNPDAKKFHQVVAYVGGIANIFAIDGTVALNAVTDADLCMKTEKKTVFINIFDDEGRWKIQVGACQTKEEAVSYARPGASTWVAIAVPIEIEV